MMEKYTQKDFLEMFNRVKSEEKNRKSTTRALVGRTERNFAKLIKAGYLQEEFEKASRQMFRDKEQWAVSTNNDTPEHILQPQNFERYLNAAENPEPKKEDKPKQEVKPIENIPQEIVYSPQEIEESRKIYEQSLLMDEWNGGIMDAVKIGKDFRESFTEEERVQFRLEGKKIAEINQKKVYPRTGGQIYTVFDRMARNRAGFVTLELAVKEAVKRKISPPWPNVK